MRYSPYDWNESVRQRNEYIEEQLKEGSPVVVVSYDAGVLMLTVRRTQRKLYEIYDRLMFAGIGRQSDIEAVRTAAIDFAHREGFQRSADDVTVKRLVGFWVSPAIKKAHADPFAAPVVMRGVFAEVGKTPQADQFFVVSYDGEFTEHPERVVIAGSDFAETKMKDHLESEIAAGVTGLDVALRAALYTWGVGKKSVEADDDIDEPSSTKQEENASDAVAEALKDGWAIEAAVLERQTRRESHFRFLKEEELAEARKAYLNQDK